MPLEMRPIKRTPLETSKIAQQKKAELKMQIKIMREWTYKSGISF